MSGKIKILYVDDEENNLISFKANYRKEYEVYTATSVIQAFELLEKNPAEIIISDQRMPNTSGVEFLEQTIKLYPDSVRLLITGQTDIDVVIQAINLGQITKFIQKPWDWEKLSLAIDNCVTIYKSRIELKEKNRELQKTNDELNKFVYSVSHDLRSPLTSILGIINLAKINEDIKATSNYFDMIESRVLKLDDFIKNIIDYYKNARDKEISERIDFKELFHAILDSLVNQDSMVKFDVLINQTDVFLGDTLRLKIIFSNLISNAIKFRNPLETSPYVKMNFDMRDNFAEITISDNGIGIEEAHHSSVFDMFFRTENSVNTEGTGLGLYIVKEAVEKIGGTISLTSKPLTGSSFKILIPNKKSDE